MHRVLILGAGKIGALISGFWPNPAITESISADVNGTAAEARGAGARRRHRPHQWSPSREQGGALDAGTWRRTRWMR